MQHKLPGGTTVSNPNTSYSVTSSSQAFKSVPYLYHCCHLGYKELYLTLLKRVRNFFNTRHRYLWLAFYSWQLLTITWIWRSSHSSSQTWRLLNPICHTCEKLLFLYPNRPSSAWLHDYKKPLVMQNSKWTGVNVRAGRNREFSLMSFSK